MERDRREFIKRALYGILALFGLGSLLAGIRLLVPAARRDREVRWFPLLSEDEAPRRGVRKLELVHSAGGRERRDRVFVVASGGGLTVLSAVCSHLGCLVTYHREKKEFLCPCHGGRYDLAGRNIAGPPPAPLTTLPHRIEKGMVMVGVKQ